MITVKDNGYMREMFPGRVGVAGAHIHGHRLELFSLFRHGSEKRRDRLLARALNGVEDSTGLEINEDGHVGVALFQTELVDPKITNLAQIDGPVFQSEPSFVDLLDQIPT